MHYVSSNWTKFAADISIRMCVAVFYILNKGISYLCLCLDSKCTLAQLVCGATEMEPGTHQNFPPSRFSPLLSPTLEFLLPDWAALMSVVTWKHAAQAGEDQKELLMSNGKATALNTHVLFLSTIFFTLIARCSEYSLHTPSKTSTHTHVHDY